MFKVGWILLAVVVLVTGISCKSSEVASPAPQNVSSPNVILDAYYTEDGELVIPNFKMTEGYDPNAHMAEWKLRIGRIESGLEIAPDGYQSPMVSDDYKTPYSYKIVEYIDGQEVK